MSPSGPGRLLRTHRRLPRPDFERIALVLQGGGALGAYQAGVYQALHEAGLEIDWYAGVSIGAINAALIAGNPREKRIDRLKAFWDGLSEQPLLLSAFEAANSLWSNSDPGRAAVNHMTAANALWFGVQDFFEPRWPPAWWRLDGDPAATSLYDTAPLRRTLARLVDFDRINGETARFTAGAVNVKSGNFIVFDNQCDRIAVDHILASAALPPMFAPVEIAGQAYWDGGLVSNTPLQWLLDAEPHDDTLVFQVDLWNTRGEIPRDLAEVVTREREIQFASRTRATTDVFRRLQRLKNGVTELLASLPEEARRSPHYAALAREADPMALRIVHLIYHARLRQGTTKEFEFGRTSIREHWKTGYDDAVRTLRHPEALSRPPMESEERVGTFDVAVHGRL